MSKLGYTWYPKDWGNSENVFELNLCQRGLYRELIDLAMLNDNQTEIKHEVWSRKFGVSINELNVILSVLVGAKLIEIYDHLLIIPSCEARLNLVRGGKKGGESKPTPKPMPKPTPKPTPKQIETKSKLKEKEIEIETKDFLLEKETKEIEVDSFTDVSEFQKHKVGVKVTGYKNPMFDIFWNLYGKKTDTVKCQLKFEKLTDAEIQKIMHVVSNYVKSTPDLKFRKNPLTWLNGKCWDDDIQVNKTVRPDAHANNPKG